MRPGAVLLGKTERQEQQLHSFPVARHTLRPHRVKRWDKNSGSGSETQSSGLGAFIASYQKKQQQIHQLDKESHPSLERVQPMCCTSGFQLQSITAALCQNGCLSTEVYSWFQQNKFQVPCILQGASSLLDRLTPNSQPTPDSKGQPPIP